MSAEEFKRRRDIIEKGLVSNNGQLGHNLLKKRKPTEASLQTLIKTKNAGQLSFADDEDAEEVVVPRKEKKPEVVKKAPVLVEEPIEPKTRVNLLEEDDETKRQKQEALEVGPVLPSSKSSSGMDSKSLKH